MTRALGPRVGMPADAAMPFTILGLAWVPVGAGGAVWLAGRAVSWATGHGWAGPDFGVAFAKALVADGVGPLWPGVNPRAIWVTTAAMVLAAVVPVLILVRKWRGGPIPGDARDAMAQADDIAGLCPRGMAAKARQLRPSLAKVPAKELDPDDTGLPLGLLQGSGNKAPLLRASWEDVLLVFMAPRSGKTTEVAVPQILAAPGAVVATSNKADLWAATAGVRERSTGGRVWAFDPQRIAHVPQSWWWNPLRGVDNVEAAQRLTAPFIAEIRGDREREFWSSAAEDLLASLFLAAGCSGRTLVDVYEWLNKPTGPVPVNLLEERGHLASAAGLQGRQAGAVETREGVFETARVAAKCLRDPNILAWVTPPDHALDEFDTATFAAGVDTLYLMTKDAAGGAAPLVAAFTDRVMQDAVRLAERQGGRLDPPLVVMLDEAANICKIADLPQQYSHLGSRGVIPVTILQSYPQGEGVWGKTGMQTMWAAATVKVIGAGMDDDRFLESVSRLIGDHDVAIRSVNQGSHNSGESISLRRQRILPVEALRQQPKGQVVLLASGTKPALLSMQPWYRGPRAAEIADAEKRALAGLTQRAQAVVAPVLSESVASAAAAPEVAKVGAPALGGSVDEAISPPTQGSRR